MTSNALRDDHDLVVSLVLFRNDPRELDICIEQILSSKRRPWIIVIDNSPEPVKLPERFKDRITIVISEKNIGYGRAHNKAMAINAGRVPYHLIMNTDVTFDGDVIDKMLTFMEHNPDVGMSAPLVRYPDGSLQTSSRLLPTPINIFSRGFLDGTSWTKNLNKRYELQEWSYDTQEDIPFLPGCFMLFRSDVLAKIGGFDERFFLFAEDTDLSRRVFLTSRGVFVPDTVIFHELRSRVKFDWRRHKYKFINFFRYFNKWGWFYDAERKRVNDSVYKTVVNSKG